MHAERHSRHVSTLNSDTATEVPARVVVELHSTSEAESIKQNKRISHATREENEQRICEESIYQGGVYLTRG